ncbi:GyrI-like domain-containing protein [Nonomuraea typhae]|uniref:GyrI-like domain-containing protein n=1 Tax=Nonomuraea typhae TaxID=2603600 RepID=UPI0012F93607|nr:GyrI-like domain-containing protein [Nonomuraea typhae]
MDIIEFPERHYVAVRKTITMTTFGVVADRIPEIYGWLVARGAAMAGAPFFRFHVIDMEGDLDVEAGVPVAEPVEGEGDIVAATLPAGRYASVRHVGHPDQLLPVIEKLHATSGLDFDMSEEADGEHWGSRLEIYHTNPAEEPDMNKWEIELQFRLKDPA